MTTHVDPSTDRRRLMAIYLADHDAAAAGAIALAERAAANSRHGDTADLLRRLARDLEHDRDVARRLMPVVGGRPAPWKELAARVAERVGRLKLNGRLRGTSPLSHVWELEALLDAVAAKRWLWRAAADVPGLEEAAGVDTRAMLARADDQTGRLEPLWLAATGMAFPGERLGDDGGDTRDGEPITTGGTDMSGTPQQRTDEAAEHGDDEDDELQPPVTREEIDRRQLDDDVDQS